MTQRIYKTARGKTVDLGKLLLQNEKTRAVGNKPVNARGDRIDSFNNVVETRNEILTKKYQSKSNVTSTPVSAPTQQPPAQPVRQSQPAAQLTPDTDVTSGELLNITPPPVANDPVVNSGLAAALKKVKKDNND